MQWSFPIIQFLVCCIVPTKLAPSMALEQESDGQKYTRHLRFSHRHSSQNIGRYRDNVGEGQANGSNESGRSSIVFQQDIHEYKQKSSSSSLLSNKSKEHELTSIQLCRSMTLNFSRASNGRGLSGGEFVRGEWFHRYGLHIYAQGHNGEENIHPMIFDSLDVARNGLGGSQVALGSPHSDFGGPGQGQGGKMGKPGANRKSLGNILIPSQNQAPSEFRLHSKGSLDQSSVGGTLIFEFQKETKVENIGFLNIGSSDQIVVIKRGGGFEEIELESVGENGFQNVHLNLGSVEKLYIHLHSYGAVTGLDLCVAK